MSDEADRLRAEAERCRQLARYMTHRHTLDVLNRIAAEFEIEAARREQMPSREVAVSTMPLR